MNDIRRTILWVIFGFSMVLLWDQWQIHNGKQATFIPTPGKPVATAAAPAGVASSGVPAAVGTVPLASAVPAGPAVAPVAANDVLFAEYTGLSLQRELQRLRQRVSASWLRLMY